MTIDDGPPLIIGHDLYPDEYYTGNTITVGRWLHGDPAPIEPATHRLDIVDEIDRLVDDQMAGGEPFQGYDYGDPQYPRCPHCRRHWHGLPITQRVAEMYARGEYDEDYRVDQDDTPVLCHGSESDQPAPTQQRTFTPPPTPWLRGERRNIAMSIRIGVDMSGFRASLDRLGAQFAALTDRARASWAQPQAQQLPDDPFDISSWLGVLRGSPFLVLYDRAHNGLWSGTYRVSRPTTAPLCLRGIKVEFGPQNWHHEMCSANRIPQFPHPYPRTFFDPLTFAVQHAWPQFAAVEHTPPAPGYDFSRYDQLDEGHGPRFPRSSEGSSPSRRKASQSPCGNSRTGRARRR